MPTHRNLSRSPLPHQRWPFAAVVVALVVIVAVDPFVTGNPWWRIANDVSAAVALLVPLTLWLGGSLGVVWWLRRREVGQIASGMWAALILASAAIPGGMWAMLLEDSDNPKPGTTLLLPIGALASLALLILAIVAMGRRILPGRP